MNHLFNTFNGLMALHTSVVEGDFNVRGPLISTTEHVLTGMAASIIVKLDQKKILQQEIFGFGHIKWTTHLVSPNGYF